MKNLAAALPRPDDLPVWAEHVLGRVVQGQAVNAQTLADAVAAVLSGLAPFVLHLEDIHDASVEHLELVQKLAQAVSRLRGVGLLVTSRTEPPEPFKSYRLEPLDQSTLSGLLEAQAKGKLPREALDWVFARTGGNPLFALEFWRYLSRQGFLWSDGQDWHWRMPDKGFVRVSVEALILQMLSLSVDEATQRVLEARAILPNRSFDGSLDALWARVSGTDPEALDEAKLVLQNKGIFHAGNFAHPLIREVVEQETPPERKQTYARRALEALRQTPQDAAVFVEGAGLAADEQRDWFERAAQAAEAEGNTTQAGRWLARAVDCAREPLRGALARRASDFLSQVDEQEATRLLEIAVRENPQDTEAVVALAGSYARMGLFVRMNRVLQNLPKDITAQTSWVKSLLSIRLKQRDFAGLLELWNQHPELHGHPGADVAYWVAFAQMEQGRPQDAEALATAALQTADPTPGQKARLYAVRGLSWRLMGDLVKALSLLDQSVEWARAARKPLNLASSLHNRQIVLEMLGMIPERMADLSEALEIYREAGDPVSYASSLTSLGLALWHTAQYEQAEVKLLEAHQTLTRFGDTAFLSNCETNLGHLYLSWRPAHALQLAQKYARSALKRAERLGQGSLGKALNLASLVEIEAGQPEQGLALAERSLRLGQIINQVRAGAHRARAAALEALGRPEEATRELEQARSLVSGVEVHPIDLELCRLQNTPETARPS